MTSLAQTLSGIVGNAFVAQGLDPAMGAVKVADRPDLAQFQCNGAMAAAKAAKKNPREVAAAIVEELKQQDLFSKDHVFKAIDIAGPGFINLTLTDEYIAKHLYDVGEDDHLGAPDLGQGELALLDSGGPNIAKAMHVGHLRAAIIGDSVRRILIFTGYKTLGDVHMGDWGTHMGMLIDDYLRNNESHLVVDADLNKAGDIQKVMEDMAERYPRAATAAKADAALMARAQQTTVKLQNKEESYYSIWKKVREVSVLGMRKNYDALGVHFDLWKGEADVHDYIAPMVDAMRKGGYAVESEGAWIVPVAANDDKKEVPPLILYKRDGGVMYGTTDLATIVERVKLYNPSKILYVVDQRQNLHFEQVFRAARKTGLVRDNVELMHVGHGTMNGPDGKPFKTRAGGVMRLEDLIAMAEEKAYIRMDEANLAKDMPTSEKEDVAHKVAIAAIKFADLQNARQADYVFDIDRLTSFEGKTGPYLLYQAVRIRSLLKKAVYDLGTTSPLHLQDGDRALALVLAEFPDAVEAAARNYAPHYLCDYAFRLAQAFSSFYGNCHILSEEDQQLRNSRLSLCAQTYKTLEQALALLGIDLPERM
jgi:arginyl-tRNA synthetase